MTPITFTPQERRITLAALMVVLLLSALDGTVVGTAMPRIIAQLHGFELFSWLTSAYMLTSTVLVPIYGKLSDLYGRKPILIIGVVVFLTGSMLCGMAGEFGDLPLIGGGMVQLIISRAIQGVGGAALFTSTFTNVADLFPPRERGKFMGLFGAVFGFAMVLGPLVGGFFTDHGTTTIFGREIAGWRWVFYVNLPVGLIALFMILFKMPRLSHKATGKVDYPLGALLFDRGVRTLAAGADLGWHHVSLGLVQRHRHVRLRGRCLYRVPGRGKAQQGRDPAGGAVSEPRLQHRERRLFFCEYGVHGNRPGAAAVHAGGSGRRCDEQRLVDAAFHGRTDGDQHRQRLPVVPHRSL